MKATPLAFGIAVAVQTLSIAAVPEYDLLELPAPLQEPVFIDRVTAISDRGDVTVTLQIVEPPPPWYRHVRYEAAAWDGRSWQTLLPSGAYLTLSAGLARGRIPLVNAYFDGPRPRYNAKPLLWRNDQTQRAFRAPMRSPDVEVTQVTRRGDVAGQYYLRGLYTNRLWGTVAPAAIPNWFFLRRGKQPVDLAALSSGRVRNVLVNNRGDVLITTVASNATPSGSELTRLVWLRNGKVEEQPVPLNWNTWPTLLAANSFVGGFSTFVNSNEPVFGMFRFHDGTFTMLNTTNEIMSIFGINDTGAFVGHSIHLGYTNWSAEVRGFVYRDGTRTDLAEVVAGASEWQPLLPEAINNKGAIACVGVRKNQERESVVILLPRIRGTPHSGHGDDH